MDESIKIAIIAAAAATLPSVVSGIFVLLNKRSDRKTEIEKAQSALYNQRRLDAVANYYAALSQMDASTLSPAALHDFIKAHEQLSVFVSQDTLSMMEIVLNKLEMSLTNRTGNHPAFDANGYAANLIRQINAELNVVGEQKKMYQGEKRR